MKKIIINTIDNEQLDVYYTSEISKTILKANNIIIDKHTVLEDNVIISSGCKIGVGCKISSGVSLGFNTVIQDESNIGKDSIISDNVKIEMAVNIGDNCVIKSDIIIGEEAIIDNDTVIINSFYKKTAKSNVTYCGNNKISIGCQLYTIDSWLNNYKSIGDKFNYTQSEINECINHIKFIKNNIQ